MPNTPSGETEELQVTTKASFQGAQKQGQLVKLPSGNVFRVKRSMDLLVMLKAGKIPNPLAGVVQKMVDKRQAVPEVSDLDENTIIETMKFVDKLVIDAVTEPKLAAPPDPEDGEDGDAYAARIEEWKVGLDDPKSPHYDPEAVPLTWLDMDDRMFIFVFAQGFAADLESFREQTRATLAPVSTGKATPKPTKRTGGGK